MKTLATLLVAAMLAIAPAARAQQSGDPIAENVFPPELVMAHQAEIGLTDEQRNGIIADISKAQPKATELQWKLQKEAQALVAIIKGEKVDEEQLLAQLDRVLALERDIKRVQLALVVRIKMRLTTDQRAKLQSFRAAGR